MGAFSQIFRKLSNKFMNDYAIEVDPDLAEKLPKIDIDTEKLPPKLSDLSSFRSSGFFQELKDYFKQEISDDFQGAKNVKIMPSSSVLEKEAAHEVDGYLYGSFPYSDFWDEVDQKDVVKIVDELKTKYSLDNEDVRNYMGEIGGAGEDIMPEVEAILNPNISALPRRPPPAADDFETALAKALETIKEDD